MSRRSAERPSEPMKVRQRDVEFSSWPMTRTNRRFGLQSRVFASDPFNVMGMAINRDCPATTKPVALAYLEQAQDFHSASQVGTVRAARPLLLYYSFMNIAKALILTRSVVPAFGDTHHGLTTKFPAVGAGPIGVQVEAFPSTGAKANLFSLLVQALVGAGLTAKKIYKLEEVLPQILLGHRLWCEATDSNERFLEIENIALKDDRNTKKCWCIFDIRRADYARLSYSQTDVLKGGPLDADWSNVRPSHPAPDIVRFEMKTPEIYTHRPSDVVNGLVSRIRHQFWKSVTIIKPFRKYYVYVPAPNEPILPQLASIYLAMFYLGSITRYRPNHFDEIVAGPYGAFIQEFIENQPNQWLYLVASEFAQQEIARAAVV